MSTTELATKQDQPLATADDFGGGIVVQGMSNQGLNLSRVVMFQGTQEEELMYGSHKRGVFIDALENRELGDKIKIMPVFAAAKWSLWEEGQKMPTETWDNEKDVPAEYLEWTEDSSGKRIKPQAQLSINVVCVVEGEQWPYLFVFKSTSIKAWQKNIQPVEARRSMLKRAPGLYELSSIDDRNANNQPFKRLTARSAGDPSPELIELAKAVYKAKSSVEARAAAMASDHGAAGDDGLGDPDL